jgi:hypothetical protein
MHICSRMSPSNLAKGDLLAKGRRVCQTAPSNQADALLAEISQRSIRWSGMCTLVFSPKYITYYGSGQELESKYQEAIPRHTQLATIIHQRNRELPLRVAFASERRAIGTPVRLLLPLPIVFEADAPIEAGKPETIMSAEINPNISSHLLEGRFHIYHPATNSKENMSRVFYFR